MSNADIARTYFDSWRAKDFDTLRGILADDVDFAGPLGQTSGIEDTIAGITGMSQIVTDIVVHKIWEDGEDVITWFELHTSIADPVPVANWTRVRDGKAVRIRAVFDARPLTAGQEK